jgi:hypothetical protein
LDTDRLVLDAEHKLGIEIDAVVARDVGPLRAVLTEMVAVRDAIVARRDRAAVAFTAQRAREVVASLEIQAQKAQVLLDRADAAFSRAGINRLELASAATLEWDDACIEIARLASEATDRAIEMWTDGVVRDGIAPDGEVDPGRWLPEIDPHPINEWHELTVDIGRRAIRRRWLHPRRSRAVRDQLWRLSIDFGRRPTKKVRKGLRGQIPDLRIERNEAFVGAIRLAGSARISAFEARLDPLGGVAPESIRQAAVALAGGGSHGSKVVVDGDV